MCASGQTRRSGLSQATPGPTPEVDSRRHRAFGLKPISFNHLVGASN